MKRANVKSEIAILSTMCNSHKPSVTGSLWMRMRPEFFGTEATREIFDRITEIRDEADSLPTFKQLRRDHSLSEGAKALLREDGILRRSEIESEMFIIRNQYQLRVCADLNDQLAGMLTKGKTPKVEKLESLFESALSSLRNPEGTPNDLMHGGVGDTRVSDLVVDILNGASMRDRIKTGWGTFDTRTGGFSRGDLVVITSGFGSGKSVAALSLFTNMTNNGNDTALVSLEMSQAELLERMLSRISKIGYSEIRLNQLAKADRQSIVDAFDRYDDRKRKRRWSFLTPTNETSVKDVFSMLSPYSYDVIFIDYIGLLKQVATSKHTREDQILGEAARYCKIMASKLNCVVVLLAQLNDDGKVMYSRAITHHANFWFKWTCSEEDKIRGFVTVEQGKARGAECYDFQLTVDFKHMSMDDYTGPIGSEVNTEVDDTGKKSPRSSEHKKEDPKRGKFNKGFNKSSSGPIPKQARLETSLLDA